MLEYGAILVFDLYAILFSVTLASAISFIFVLFYTGYNGYPRSVLLMYYILNALATVAIRLSVRTLHSYHEESPLKNPHPKKILLLIGAGKTGEKIAREIMTTSRHNILCWFC